LALVAMNASPRRTTDETSRAMLGKSTIMADQRVRSDYGT
jgi:hypothetical protein